MTIEKSLVPKKECIDLSFHLESTATLWNRIFEGFESDVTLVSRFETKDKKSLQLLYRFGSMIQKKFTNCKVEPKSYGIVIIRDIDEDQKEFISEWINLMKSLKCEITDCI